MGCQKSKVKELEDSFSGACYVGDLEKIQKLFNPANIDEFDDDGMAPVHRACQRGHIKVLQFLIEKKANIRLRSQKSGETPLHVACFYRHYEIVNVLLGTIAVKDIHTRDQHGFTPLHVAVNRGSSQISMLLLERNAPLDVEDNCGVTPIEMAKARAEQENQGLATPLSEYTKTYNILLAEITRRKDD